MAAPSRQDVETMIEEALKVFEVKVGQILLAQRQATVTVDQARVGLAAVADQAKTEMDKTEVRIKELVTQNNATFASHEVAMNKIVADLQTAGVDGTRLNLIASNVDTALNGTKALSEKNEKMKEDLDKLSVEFNTQIGSVKVDAEAHIKKVRDEASNWADGFKGQLVSLMEASNAFG